MEKQTLGICLIGCGRAGMIHANNYKNKVPNGKMVAVVDAVESVAKDAAQVLGIDTYYTDYKDMLQNPLVDAVVVVSPTHLHRQIVVDCAAAKKHIFCEKPMAMNTAECDEMIAACDANNVKLQIGFMRRFDNSFQEAKRLIAQGAIGELVQIHSCTRGPSKPRPWMYSLEKSNGILAEVNSHDIDSLRWMADSDVDSLYAVAGNFRNKEVTAEFPDYYDSVLMNGTMKNGVHFSVDGAAYVQYGYDSKMELIGTTGKLQVGRSNRDFVQCTTANYGTTTPFITSWTSLFTDAYLSEDISFVNAILNDMAPEVTGVDGRMAVATVEAGNESILSKKIVAVK